MEFGGKLVSISQFLIGSTELIEYFVRFLVYLQSL